MLSKMEKRIWLVSICLWGASLGFLIGYYRYSIEKAWHDLTILFGYIYLLPNIINGALITTATRIMGLLIIVIALGIKFWCPIAILILIFSLRR